MLAYLKDRVQEEDERGPGVRKLAPLAAGLSPWSKTHLVPGQYSQKKLQGGKKEGEESKSAEYGHDRRARDGPLSKTEKKKKSRRHIGGRYGTKKSRRKLTTREENRVGTHRSRKGDKNMKYYCEKHSPLRIEKAVYKIPKKNNGEKVGRENAESGKGGNRGLGDIN